MRTGQFLLAALAVPLSLTLAAAQEQSFLSVDDDPDSDGPVTMEYTPDGAWVLILHHQSNDVSFLDSAAQSVVDAVSVGEGPLDLEIASHGTLAVTADYLGNTLTVVSIPTRQVLGTVPLSGTKPYQVELTSDGWTAVVGLAGDGPGTSSVSVVDLQNLIEVRNFPVVDQEPLPTADGPWWTGDRLLGQELPSYPRFDLSPDDRTLVVPYREGKHMRLYDITTGKKAGKRYLDLSPVAVGVSPDGSFAVAIEPGMHSLRLARVDLTTLVRDGPFFVLGKTFDPKALIVTNQRAIVGTGNRVQFVNPVTGKGFGVHAGATDLELSHDGRFVIASLGEATSIIDVATKAVLAEFALGGGRVAVSPVTNEAAVLPQRHAEEIHLLDANGAAASLLGTLPTGMPQEGDAPVDLALAEEAGLVLTANTLSRNIAVADIVGGRILRWIPVDGRPVEVAVDPAATVAVVATGSNVLVIDPRSGLVQATLPFRAQGLSISADATEAYMIRTKPIEFTILALSGAASQVVVSLPVPGYANNVLPEARTLSVSSSGVLALPVRGGGLPWSPLPEELLLYDIEARGVLARVDLQGQPKRATIAPDGRYAYVSMSPDNFQGVLFSPVKKVRVAKTGELSRVVASIELTDPDWIGVSRDNQTLYVQTIGTGPTLTVLDAASTAVLCTVPLPPDVIALELNEPFLVVATLGGVLHTYLADGADTMRIKSAPLVDFPRDLVLSETLHAALTAQPGVRDGLDIVSVGGTVSSYCGPANLNSTGAAAIIELHDWILPDREFTLVAKGLPANRMGYFLFSADLDFVPFVSGSQGNLCLGGTIGRFVDQVANSGTAGELQAVVDPTSLPFGEPVSVQVGETWHFQAWFRDVNPGPTSNFTDAAAVTFE